MTNPNDSAYPLENDIYVVTPHSVSSPLGFSKREIVLKDFMCAIAQGSYACADISIVRPENVVQAAIGLTEAYFNELNKQQ